LYSYLKPFPQELHKIFYEKYGGETAVSVATSSPVLGNLNSGMQLYRLKNERSALFNQVKYSLHLPQYASYLITGKAYSDITSVGCHTGLWDFTSNSYHDWVQAEGILPKLAPLFPCNEVIDANVHGKMLKAGVGLHDSSAALIPYLSSFSEPFMLLSTGTWCISLNPFNADPLTADELKQDCLCYMSYQGRAVKASRLFAGNEHEQQVKILAGHFNTPEDYYTQVAFDYSLLPASTGQANSQVAGLHSSAFGTRPLAGFASYEAAYHQLIADIMQQQKCSTELVINNGNVKRIFVDGGFAKNSVYMHLLAIAFPAVEVFAASVSQATAIGAALAIHPHWNSKPVPGDMVELKYYSVQNKS
jgi:sugar (pentulose or hexulose) kinase